jgi:hypothetical protein
MSDMSDGELQKLRYLAVQYSLWEKERCINAEALFNLQYLKKFTLAVERLESIDSKEVAFEIPKDSDGTFFECSDDSNFDSNSLRGCVWPEDSEDLLKYILDEVSVVHNCNLNRPWSSSESSYQRIKEGR